MKEKLMQILADYFELNDTYAYNLTRDKRAFAVGTVTIDDFEEFNMDVIADIADFLIKNGVIVPPCKVGDTVYDIADGTAYATKVLQFVYFGDRWACRTVSSFPNLEGFGTRVFLTREEAEKALKESEGI